MGNDLGICLPEELPFSAPSVVESKREDKDQMIAHTRLRVNLTYATSSVSLPILPNALLYSPSILASMVLSLPNAGVAFFRIQTVKP